MRLVGTSQAPDRGGVLDGTLASRENVRPSAAGRRLRRHNAGRRERETEMACGSRRGLSLIWHSICLAPASHESVSPATRLPLAGLLIALALAGCSASSTTVPSTAGTTPVQSPNASPGSQDSANVGQGTAVTWQTGDLTLPTAFQFEQLV